MLVVRGVTQVTVPALSSGMNAAISWKQLSADIDSYCSQKEIRYTNYFYHSLLVAEKKKSNAREIRTS